jgi:hypothetical protein
VQWLDQATAQVLGFVGRRLLAEPVGLVFAARTTTVSEDPLAGLPDLRLSGLDERPARALLASVTTGRLDESVRRRILEEAHGNPLALRELGVVDFAGGFAMPDSVSVPRRIEDQYLTRLRGLPRVTQRLLLVAAADPVGDPALLASAARQLNLDFGHWRWRSTPGCWTSERACGLGIRCCGAAALARAQLADGDVADELYRDAIELFSRTRMVSHLARARLCYGEWLRRNIVVPTLPRSCDAPSMSLRPWAPTPLPNAPAESSRPRAKRYAPTARAPAPD